MSASKEIERAWRLRFQQKNAEAELALAALEEKLSELSLESRWEVGLLEVSLLRSKGKLPESNQRLEALGRDIFSRQKRAPFQYYFQKALNVFVTDDFSVALEFFLLADSVAQSSEDRLSCLMNVLTCLENLNLPWEETLEEVEALIDRSGPGDEANPVRRQLTAFKLRHFFRNGEVGKAFAESLSPEMDQSHYYRLWIAGLPYLALSYSGEKESLQRLSRSKDFYAKAYRLKTVTSDPRLLDGEAREQTAQQVDRIYLWTWKWLADPSGSHRTLLRDALRDFDFHGAFTRMTFEDYQLLKNALSWIALFQKQLAGPISEYLDRFSVNSCPGFPIFTYEDAWIEYLRSCKRGRPDPELRRTLEAHPLHASPELRLREIAGRWADDFSRSKKLPQPSRERVVVEEETFRIMTWKKTIVSEPLTRILVAIAEAPGVEFADLLWVGFGISSYQPEIHQPKIQNALSRLKEIVPKSVTIKTKNQRVYWAAPAEALLIIQPSALEKRLSDQPLDFRAGSQNASRVFERPIHPRAVVERAQGRRVLKREEIAKVMKLSKASTVRWLQKWMDQGLIRREGAGPSMRYHIEISDRNRLSEIG